MLYDLVVIGGGINGAGIAADAAGRGLKVLLVEKADLGGATSSASSKLIHGGLRYLEHLEFRLVREALQEREVLAGQRRPRHLAAAVRLAAGRQAAAPVCCFGPVCFSMTTSGSVGAFPRPRRSTCGVTMPATR